MDEDDGAEVDMDVDREHDHDEQEARFKAFLESVSSTDSNAVRSPYTGIRVTRRQSQSWQSSSGKSYGTAIKASTDQGHGTGSDRDEHEVFTLTTLEDDTLEDLDVEALEG